MIKRRPLMAKYTLTIASEDDPIYRGGFKLSSPNLPKPRQISTEQTEDTDNNSTNVSTNLDNTQGEEWNGEFYLEEGLRGQQDFQARVQAVVAKLRSRVETITGKINTEYR